MSISKLSGSKVQISLLSSIEDELNAHLQGFKRVFVNNSDTDTPLTQFAYGIMNENDQSGMHVHKTMDEYFFILKGGGILDTEKESFGLIPSTFLRIPAGIQHNLINKNNHPLEFVYFGIAIDDAKNS